MFQQRPQARLLVCGVQALIREGGEQGPPGGSLIRLTSSSRAWGLLVRALGVFTPSRASRHS